MKDIKKKGEIKRKCLICGKNIIPTERKGFSKFFSKKKYCSPKCKKTAQNRRRNLTHRRKVFFGIRIGNLSFIISKHNKFNL